MTDLHGLCRALDITVGDLKRDRRYYRARGDEMIVLETRSESPGAQFHIVEAPPWLVAQDFGPLPPRWVKRGGLIAHEA